jgi:hypothetical protein
MMMVTVVTVSVSESSRTMTQLGVLGHCIPNAIFGTIVAADGAHCTV